MNTSTNSFVIRVLGIFAGAALSLTSMGAKNPPLHVKGYQAAINANDFASEPGAVHVQFEGEGGAAHFGRITSHSDNQRVDLATGALTATVTFKDLSGDILILASAGSSAQQPDGRITFTGNLTVTGGSGKFSGASGHMAFDGWARITDSVALTGIGFFTFEGDLFGVNVAAGNSFTIKEEGNAVFDGVNFVYTGAGTASHFGKFNDVVQTFLEPFDGAFNGGFMGIVNGRIVLISSFENEWTHPNGTKLLSSGIEFVSFAITSDGAPDFTQLSIADVYETINGGSGRFAGARGVMFQSGDFVPTAPELVSAKLFGNGVISVQK